MTDAGAPSSSVTDAVEESKAISPGPTALLEIGVATTNPSASTATPSPAINVCRRPSTASLPPRSRDRPVTAQLLNPTAARPRSAVDGRPNVRHRQPASLRTDSRTSPSASPCNGSVTKPASTCRRDHTVVRSRRSARTGEEGGRQLARGRCGKNRDFESAARATRAGAAGPVVSCRPPDVAGMRRVVTRATHRPSCGIDNRRDGNATRGSAVFKEGHV